MEFLIKSFTDLQNEELYQIMQARLDVFVLEQHCMDRDLDNLDLKAMHCFIKENDQIVAYCRLLPAGVKYEQPSIGRVLTVKESRHEGLASKMLASGIQYIEKNWKPAQIKVQAQAHLEAFYGALGFEAVSDVYEDVGIPHIDMLKTVPSLNE